MTDKTPVHVRPLQAADRSRWNELWTGYLDYYETTLPPEIYDVYFDRLLGDDPPAICRTSMPTRMCVAWVSAAR